MSHSMLLQERPPVVSGYNGPTQFGSALNVPLLNGRHLYWSRGLFVQC